jgi:molybdate transport system substrate-binding protein
MHIPTAFRHAFACLALLAFTAGCTKTAESAAPSAPAQPTSAPAAKTEVVVYAATSTRDALQALQKAYEAAQPVTLVFNFGSSSDLSQQIIAASKADVFVSADDKEMDKVEKAGLVVAGTRQELLSNQLVVIEPREGASPFSGTFEPRQLADPRITRLSLGHVETVPAGRYAKAWLEKSGVWKDVADRVLPGVDVRAALAAVESGGAQAGIVYRTDMARSKNAKFVFAVPLEDGPKIRYPIAVLTGRPAEAQARAFAAWLASDEARASFEEFGFVFLPAAKSK